MDIALIRSFLEVAATGSFMNAADRLFVTQSAVSQRIQRLEDQLGRPLFKRSKVGVTLTPAGREFESYALSLIKIWEEARQQIAVPEGFTRSLSIGAQYSLWPRVGFRLIDKLRSDLTDLSIRAEIGLPDRLTRYLLEGLVQVGVMYTPQLRPGLKVRQLFEEELILVAAFPDPDLTRLAGRYVMIDWGSEFVQAHALHLPELTHPGITFSLGAMTADFIRNREMAAYLPARYAKRFLDSGELYLVPEAPAFEHPAWAVWREDIEDGLLASVQEALTFVATQNDIAQKSVHGELAHLNREGVVESLGDL